MTTPRVFVSYSWESPEHKSWVKKLATHLRKHGVETLLDQWELAPGDQLPRFMERSVRDSDFVLVVCTPKYRERSDSRAGGVGYEGDIMTAEIATGTDRRKFIPLLRSDSWDESAPSWLRGSYYIDLRLHPSETANYQDLLQTLLGRREKAPPIGTPSVPAAAEAHEDGDDESELPAPVDAYLRVRAWMAEQSSEYPIAVDASMVGWYGALTKAGGGYFYDEVLEYRVWIHPHEGGPELSEGDDYFCAFPSYEQALEFADEVPGAEEPLALVR